MRQCNGAPECCHIHLRAARSKHVVNQEASMDFLKELVAAAPDLAEGVEQPQKPKRKRCGVYGKGIGSGGYGARGRAAPCCARREGPGGAAQLGALSRASHSTHPPHP